MRQFIGKSFCWGAVVVGAVVFSARTGAEDAVKPAAKPAEAGPAMTAAHVLDKALEASGGKTAWEKVKTMEKKITMEALDPSHQGLKFTVVNVSKAPNLYYTMIQVQGMKVEQGFDGKKGWIKDPMMGLRNATGVELDTMRLNALEANYNWRSCFVKAEYQGMEKVGDADAHKVELTLKGGFPFTHWYDAKTFLLLRQTVLMEDPAGVVEALCLNNGETLTPLEIELRRRGLLGYQWRS